MADIPVVINVGRGPSQDRPNDFDADCEGLLSKLPDFANGVNTSANFINGKAVESNNAAQAAAQSAATANNQALIATQQASAALASVIASTGAASTSTSAVAWQTGVQVITTQLNKAFVVGQQVIIAATNAPESFLIATVKAYVAGTGVLTINVSAVRGIAPGGNAWTISVTGPAGDGVLKNTAVITVSGVWIAPATCTMAEVTVIGGGESSGTGANCKPGGAAGGTAIKTSSVVPGASYSVVVGGAGARVTVANTNGNAGGTSTFSGPNFTQISATGGANGMPGVGTGGDLNIAGGYPSVALINIGSTSSGGSSSFGPGGPQNKDAENFGAGAGGTYGATTGNVGKSGVVIIKYN